MSGMDKIVLFDQSQDADDFLPLLGTFSPAHLQIHSTRFLFTVQPIDATTP